MENIGKSFTLNVMSVRVNIIIDWSVTYHLLAHYLRDVRDGMSLGAACADPVLSKGDEFALR